MPKGLVIGAIAAVVLLIVLMSWLNKRSLEQPQSPGNDVAAAAPAPAEPAPKAPSPAPAAAPASAQGPVVLTATAPVWMQVSEKGGATLFSGTLQPNQTYAVPATATTPVLKTGKPEALKVTVGSAVAPAVGPPATTVSNVSLLPADLMKAPAQPAAANAVPAAKPAAPRRRSRPPVAAAPEPAPAPAEPAPTTNSAQ